METAGVARCKSTRAAWNSWLVFADESGQNLGPPEGRTWARKGRTPVLPVAYRGQGRVSIAAHQDWLLVYRFPAYAPELNPAEGIWACLRTKLFNFTVCGIDELTALIKNRLKPMQYRPDLLNGFIAETGLTIPDQA